MEASAAVWQARGMSLRGRARAGLIALCLVGAAVGCGSGGSEVAGAPAEPWPEGLPRPQDVAEAQRLKHAGTRWTNRQARQLYLERVATIAGEDAKGRAEGLPALERAARAFKIRHEARMVSRAMMSDEAEVELLRDRDREKYGDPDGPSFESLVEKAREKGLAGEAVYESIVESAQRTDAATNRGVGL